MVASVRCGVKVTDARPPDTQSRMSRWAPIIERAAEIVEEYETAVTLRQTFYRLVAEGLIANTQSAYKRLSELTPRARREGTFPPLLDRTRQVERVQTFASPAEALDRLEAGLAAELLDSRLELRAVDAIRVDLGYHALERVVGGLGRPVRI
jgi:hypothetical protein